VGACIPKSKTVKISKGGRTCQEKYEKFYGSKVNLSGYFDKKSACLSELLTKHQLFNILIKPFAPPNIVSIALILIAKRHI